EFVGPVRVGMRAENAGDHELGLWIFLAEHRHEGNRTAFAHERDGLAEMRNARLVQRRSKPGRELRRIPAGLAVIGVECDLGPIWRALLELALERGCCVCRIAGRRQTDAE